MLAVYVPSVLIIRKRRTSKTYICANMLLFLRKSMNRAWVFVTKWMQRRHKQERRSNRQFQWRTLLLKQHWKRKSIRMCRLGTYKMVEITDAHTHPNAMGTWVWMSSDWLLLHFLVNRNKYTCMHECIHHSSIHFRIGLDLSWQRKVRERTCMHEHVPHHR